LTRPVRYGVGLDGGREARRRGLVDNELVDDSAAARFLADHPDPDLP
jgi:hypothetical protein